MKRRLLSSATVIFILLVGMFGIASPAQAAPTYEWNTAAAASPPSGLPCISLTGATACWQQDGDTMWVKDTYADGRSATFSWHVPDVTTTIVRHGSCVNKLGDGRWGRCAKNFHEGEEISMQACIYKATDNAWFGCSGAKWVIA